MMTFLLFIFGLIFLISGAEILVRGASNLASALRISPLIIGLTVVSFGTSSPELAVSITSALNGQESLTFGTIIGSNIFNVLFILGISALIIPLTVSKQLIRFDVPLMIVLSITVLIFSLNGVISLTEGCLLVLGLLIYILLLFYQGRKEGKTRSVDNEFTSKKTGIKSWFINSGLVAGGLGLLVLGSGWFLNGAVTIATFMGVSEVIIGLTIVAAGTSMPEVVTSVMAAIRKEREIAVGNVVGSNIFNILGVLGISSMIASSGIEVGDSVIRFDLPVMIAVAFACLPIFFTGGIISRSEGALLFAYYLIYTLYLVLAATHHDTLPVFSSVMIWFVFPLTVIVLLIIGKQQFSRQKNPAE